PPAPPPSYESSDSDSKDKIFAKRRPRPIASQTTMAPTPAAVTQSSASHAPMVSGGTLTVANLRAFEQGCKRYFSTKAIAAPDQVRRVIYNFEDETVSSWIFNIEDELMNLSFSDFMARLCDKWLSNTWFVEYGKILMTPQSNTPFTQWVNTLRNANKILRSEEDLYMDNKRLCCHICVLLSDDLGVEYGTINSNAPGVLDTIADLNKWIARIGHMDDNLRQRKDRD
ncbi:hypothetical protein H0H87_009472, partial [Tephrocybe sp. NHM501043]